MTHSSPRRLACAFALACAVAAVCHDSSLSGQDNNFQDGVLLRDARAKDLFNSGRVAIFGGPGGIARLRAMRLKGRSRFPASDGTLLSATVEIRVLLPDRYLRLDSGAFGRRMAGYAGNQTLDKIETPDGKAVQNSGDMPKSADRAGHFDRRVRRGDAEKRDEWYRVPDEDSPRGEEHQVVHRRERPQQHSVSPIALQQPDATGQACGQKREPKTVAQ